MVERITRVLAAAVLALIAWRLPNARRNMTYDIAHADAAPGVSRPPLRPADDARGLDEAPLVRVVLIDGVNLEDARGMPAWNAVCARGLDLELDVGFPTVSLPVQVSLWTGLTQQQSGILYHSGFPLDDPLGLRGIPAQAARNGGSIAVAESHPYIVQSLGFATALPPMTPPAKGWDPAPKGGPNLCATEDDPTLDAWGEQWRWEAASAVNGTERLAFVHVLRVDTVGHRCGRRAPAWRHAIATSDAILGELLALRPDARWFVLADHGHMPKGGHGGDPREIRRVRACIAGPGIEPRAGGPIALPDLSRAIADSLGVETAPRSRGRPLEGALANPVRGDELVPGVPAPRVALAIAILLLGAIVTAAALGTRSLLWSPWWWPVAVLAVVIALGAPDLSATYVFAREGEAIASPARWGTYLAAIWTAAAVIYAGRPGWRIGIAQVALPLAGALAAMALCGALPALWADTTVPIAPRWSAWASVLLVIATRALWAVALALLATSVLPAFDPWAPRGTRRSGS